MLLHQATYADFMLWCASHTASRRLLKQKFRGLRDAIHQGIQGLLHLSWAWKSVSYMTY